MKRNLDLAAALKEETPVESTKAQKINAQTAKAQPSRIGKKSINIYTDPDVKKQLKLIGLEEDRTIDDMLKEAINDFFAKKGKSQIA